MKITKITKTFVNRQILSTSSIELPLTAFCIFEVLTTSLFILENPFFHPFFQGMQGFLSNFISNKRAYHLIKYFIAIWTIKLCLSQIIFRLKLVSQI